MSDGEMAFLALVTGSMVVFAVVMIWLRWDYVRFLDRSSGRASMQTGGLHPQMAE